MRIKSSWCKLVNVGMLTWATSSTLGRSRENPEREPVLVPLSEAPLTLLGPALWWDELVPVRVVPVNADDRCPLESPE